jgi:hypothetical protein
MAQRGREGMAKRARERARQERQEAKRLRRESILEETPEAEQLPDESALMEEFRELSERHAAGLIAENAFQEERHRIFVDLGIESDEDS